MAENILMTVPKYKKQVEILVRANQELIDTYLELEEKFEQNADKYKDELSDIKNKLLRVIRKNEDRLCSKTESTHYSAYSEGLALKYWEEIRKLFPNIDKIIK